MQAVYKIGIEEEYFVIDLQTRNLRRLMPRKSFRSCQRLLEGRVASEMLQCQIEVMTAPCATVEEARGQLGFLRKTAAHEGATILASWPLPRTRSRSG
jgi:carboxylate-amine ligase